MKKIKIWWECDEHNKHRATSRECGGRGMCEHTAVTVGALVAALHTHIRKVTEDLLFFDYEL